LIKSRLKEGLLSPDEFSIIIIVTLMTILITPILYSITQKVKEKDLDDTDL